MLYSNIDGRFKDAPWYLNSKNEHIYIVGAGGIGSNTMFALSKTIPAQYYICDNDVVEEINIGTQHFKKVQVGQFKVAAVTTNCGEQSNCKIAPLTNRYDGSSLPIMITGLDNMKTRKEVFEAWKSQDDREILIDGRLRASLYEIYVVTKGEENEYEKTLFDDSEIDDGPCTFKQTAYFGMLIGARITQVLVNYLTNKYSGDPICIVPFKIQEFGEPFYINVE